MTDSIFDSIKAMLGISSEYTAFDQDILIQINSAISILTQIGVGESSGYKITGSTETWSDYLGDDNRLEFIKEYIYLKVRRIFDPPASSSVLKAIEDSIKELEWRINVAVDTEVDSDS